MLSKPTIKYIQSLQHKKFRDEYRCFTAEGPKVVMELLLSNAFVCKRIYALDKWVESLDPSTLDQCRDNLETIQLFELEKIAQAVNPHQVVAIFEQKDSVSDFNVKEGCTLVLDDIQDPGNLGTIIRTADWYGIKNIVCSLNTVDVYNNKVVQSTMASLARVNVLYADLPEWLQQQKGVLKIAATLDGEPGNKFGQLAASILIIGNEGKGISSSVLKCADEKITITRIGEAESLNAAVATGILLNRLTQSAS